MFVITQEKQYFLKLFFVPKIREQRIVNREQRIVKTNKDMIKSYKEFVVWQRAMELVDEIYLITRQMPPYEQYILVAQILRAVISIPSNIAEGWSRNHKAEFIRFLGIAYASSAEVETQIIIAKKQYPDVNYKKAENLLIEVQKMLVSLINKIKNSEREW